VTQSRMEARIVPESDEWEPILPFLGGMNEQNNEEMSPRID
jgi:hypothetical protein